MHLWDVSQELSRRLIRIFLRDGRGLRPVYTDDSSFQSDPHWRDLILFYEYFHGDLGTGLGASHQTGWTGLVAKLISQVGGLERTKVTTTLDASAVREALESMRVTRRPTD